MQFVDKSINKAIKWNSVNVSIKEMADIVQTEIIEKASTGDLRRLEKGMMKSWVLGIGSGGSIRYYPSWASDVRIQVEYSLLTRTIISITVQDARNKTEYFIPKGKANCDKFRRAVLRRLSQFNDEDEFDPDRFNRKSRSGSRKGVVVSLVVIFLALLAYLYTDYKSAIPRHPDGTISESDMQNSVDQMNNRQESAPQDQPMSDQVPGKQAGAAVTFTPYTADEMLTDLEQNALRAEKKYQDQNLEISGYISNFDSDGEYICVAGDSFLSLLSIQCYITDEAQLDTLLDLNIGDPIRIQGNVFAIGEIIGYQVAIAKVIPGEVVRPDEPPKPVETQPLLPTDSYVEPSYGSVRRSAVEIRIRSGPSTSYADIGRLKGGTQVTIYEQQQEASGRWWGRMDDGWVCMDYIVFGEDNSVAPDYNDSIPQSGNTLVDYCGKWGDMVSQRCMMEITQDNGYLYISISWGSSAFETTFWDFVGELDRSEGGVVYYSNGVCTHYKTGEDGIGREETVYSNGSGILILQGGYIKWHDDIENAGSRCVFERVE